MKKKMESPYAFIIILFCFSLFGLLSYLINPDPTPTNALHAMRNRVEENNPQQAIVIGRDWLDKNLEDYGDFQTDRLCELMVDIYREELQDEAGALAFLEEYKEKATRGQLNGKLESLYFDAVYGEEDFAALLPAPGEYLLEEKPFLQWKGRELWDWLPVTRKSVTDVIDDYDEYRKESFGAVEIEILWKDDYLSDYERTVELSFYCPKPDKTEKAPALPTLPRGIAFGENVKTVMEKLGFDQSFIEEYAGKGSVTLTLSEDGADLWVIERKPDEKSLDLVLDYSTGEEYFRFTFGFTEDILTLCRLKNGD